jgi:hypothetical protein
MSRTLLIAAIFLLFVVGIQEKAPQKDIRQGITFRFNEGVPSFSSDTLFLISFGYPHLLSNLLWLHFLQNTVTQKVPRGETSWIYYDLNAILDLDPYFLPAVHQGGIFLSIVTEDKEGARLLFEKGTRLFPYDWRTRAYLGYHYDWELGNQEKAKESYRIGASLPGAPFLLGLLAARFTAKQNSMKAGIALLDTLIEQTKDPLAKKKFIEKKIALEHGRQR